MLEKAFRKAMGRLMKLPVASDPWAKPSHICGSWRHGHEVGDPNPRLVHLGRSLD
jgi:hypothetical protein